MPGPTVTEGFDYQDLDVATLRRFFRRLLAFRVFFEETSQDYITSEGGVVWSLWDIEYLYAQVEYLPQRQRQAIELCLILNCQEKEAAVKMGVAETNPVAMYAADGLKKIVNQVKTGSLPKFAKNNRALLQHKETSHE